MHKYGVTYISLSFSEWNAIKDEQIHVPNSFTKKVFLPTVQTGL